MPDKDAAEQEKHLSSSAHLFRAAARGPIVEVSSDEADSKKKRQDPQDRSARQGAPKRSRVDAVFVEDLSHTESGGESPVCAVNVIAVPSDDSSGAKSSSLCRDRSNST